ncbi:hypothetical protein OIU84_018056 [Salix udensis]|uniref:RRM domain-containing protein n=1 Tax=Salix udensis TaxID=889485 RepID=A0AAD6L4X2_9ROSI|nr:hypothetical protein OIU84_018056 [Salix udensis]
MEPAARAIEPTMLMLKFPPETSLPSAAQLKARFARFGSIDQSAIRVFWKSSQCRVVFRRKLDAQAALKYALGNKSLFGDVNVRLRFLLLKRQAVAFAHQPPSQSAVQLKSILKRANDDEAALVTGGNGSRGNRVKFVKSFQKFFPPSPLPILPLPAQSAKAPLNNSRHHTEIAPRNLHNFNPPPSSKHRHFAADAEPFDNLQRCCQLCVRLVRLRALPPSLTTNMNQTQPPSKDLTP